jgi:hypothetical protein
VTVKETKVVVFG